MAENFYTIITKVGAAKIANAFALGTNVNITQLAVGDGNGAYYNPTEIQTALVHEVWRGSIQSLSIDPQNPNWIVAEIVIPTTDGGFTVREAGIFDDAGSLIAVGKYPETYKPLVADGSAKDLYIKMIMQVSNTASVTLKVDPSIVLASKSYVDLGLATKETPAGAQTKASAAETNAKAYADTKDTAHVAAADPHTQYALDTDLAGHLAEEAQLHAQWDAQDLTLDSGTIISDTLCWLGSAIKYTQGATPSVVSLASVLASTLRYGKFSAAFRIKSNNKYIAPTVIPTTSYATNAGSTLANTTYYVKYTWVYANGAETGASPEKSQALGATGRNLVVTLPALPVGVVRANIYISTVTNTEKYQGQTVTTSYVQSTPISTTNPPAPATGEPPLITTLKVSDVSDGNVTTLAIKHTDIVDVDNYQMFYVPFENKGQFSDNTIKFSLTCESHPTLEIKLDSIVITPIHIGSYA